MKKSEKQKLLIVKFCKEKCNWAANMKMAKQLLILYPNIDFWADLELDFKLNFLSWFNTPDGVKLLTEKYKIFNFSFDSEAEKKYDIQDKKFGADYVSNESKKLTQLEFLNKI